MSFRSFIYFLIVDILILVLVLILRFKVLTYLPINWNSILAFLFISSIFVLFILINIVLSLIRRSVRQDERSHRERVTIKVNAETKPVITILLLMVIFGAVIAVTGALTKIDLEVGTSISFAQTVSNFLIGVIYLTLIAPLVVIWGLLTVNTET